MRLILPLSLVIFFISCARSPVREPASRRVQVTEQDLRISSSILKMEYPYIIYRPQVQSDRPLPVVYFLHGRGGTREMLKELNVVKLVKEYFELGGKPFVVVALSGTFNGKDTYWVDDARPSGLQLKTALLREIIPEIERRHKIGGRSARRVIAGISMGSHGAFQISLTSAGMFRCTAGHSLVIRDYKSMSNEFPGLFGNERDFAKRDPLSLLKNYILGFRPFMRNVWIDIGGKDDKNFIRWARGFKSELVRLGYTEANGDTLDIGEDFPDGRHDTPYWTARFPQYLEWYGKCFDQ
jgi:S-formylglutathione hydrolase FrmB